MIAALEEQLAKEVLKSLERQLLRTEDALTSFKRHKRQLKRRIIELEIGTEGMYRSLDFRLGWKNCPAKTSKTGYHVFGNERCVRCGKSTPEAVKNEIADYKSKLNNKETVDGAM